MSLHRSRAAALCVLLCAAVSACSSDSADHPSGVDGTGGAEAGSGASAGNGASAGRSGAGSGGKGNAGTSSAEAGEAGALNAGSTSGGAAGDIGTGEPPLAPAACSEQAAWATPSTLSELAGTGAATLLSVTSDELDLAYTRAGALYVVHRATASAAFSTSTAIVLPSGWSAAQGAALSADGKRLLLVSDPDQKKLGEMTRAARTNVFAGAVDESAFAAVNQDAVYTGKLYASPVLSAADDQLFYNSTFPAGTSTVVVSTGSAGSGWTAPVQLTSLLLDGDVTTRRLPTGVSADARTLFYFNEATMKEEARWRDAPNATSPLYDTASLGSRRGAAPNSACNRLYSSANGDLVVEKD